MASVKYIARMPQQRKLAVLTAFVKAQETAALDEAVDVLDMLILDITRAAKKTGQKKRLRTLKDLDRAALILARACSLLLDEQADDAELRETIFNSIPKSRLAESVSKVNELARPQNNNFHDEMVEQYGRVKRFLPAVLRDLHFQAAPAGEHTLSAIHYLTELNGSKKRILDNAPEHIITGPWKRLVPALTRHRLSWVKQNYLRAETLVSANARLVDFQSTLELAGRWGGGEVASADGMRFVTPVKTVNSGPNRKYFGSGRGITWYNFVSDQYSGFHGIVVPGTLRDSIFVLEGLLEQQTGLNPVEIMTDTAGTSDIIFGLFWLLGYQFSPRLADAGEAVFWRVDKSANYGALDELARGCADLSKAEDQWDEMMRTAGSLKLGTIHASELIRSLLKSSRPSGLAQAIMEVGRVNKTLYLLNYIDDEDYRRRILTQLNRGEGRHAVARAICYGQRGEIRKRYREGQEDQLGALGLVTNAVVLWNTLYMQEALSWIRSNGEEIGVEDIARLSPLMHGHINMLGHYTFTLPEDILKGELRELNFNLNNELTS